MNNKGQNIGIMGLTTSDGFDLSPSDVYVHSIEDVTEDALKAMGIDKTVHRRKILKYATKLRVLI